MGAHACIVSRNCRYLRRWGGVRGTGAGLAVCRQQKLLILVPLGVAAGAG